VGEDYYIATSTFEWYPGVQIHHSRDLVNWTLVARPLKRAALLDMRGNPDSCGVWAPCLSHADGKFWLMYTDVKRLDGPFKDAHNYITACETIDGDWCDPWYVNSQGFDPTLFHDTDGRKYVANVQWNHRGAGTGVNPAHDAFDGILLQEWSPDAGLTGPVRNIYAGTPRGLTEAPHIFQRNGYYYLTTAEGGTGYEHAVTLSRSRDIWGPYENHPDLHVICAEGDTARIFRNDPDALVLIGRESVGSWFEQSLVARRQEHHRYDAQTTVDFAPDTYQKAAGLTTYYNAHKYHAAVVTHDATLGRVVTIMSCAGDWPDAAVSFPCDPVVVPDGPVDLRVSVDQAQQQFYVRVQDDWTPLGPALDASVISDEGGKGEHASFTGAFVGMLAFDVTGQGAQARFTRFDYLPR